VLLLTGYEADMSLCRQLGVELKIDSQAPQFDPATMETNVPGLYVAGTATAGTQGRFTVFIENCHVHVERIMAALTGAAAPADAAAPTPTEKLES
jgi:thioredoxin reductase (NADPH)